MVEVYSAFNNTAPAPSSLPPLNFSGPTFEEIMKRVNTPLTINGAPSLNPNSLPTAGTGADTLFNRGMTMAAPSAGTDPALQEVLNRIRLSTEDAGRRGMSEAQALAVRRGIQGSSTEQFGVQSALGEAEKAARDAEAQVYIQDAVRRFQLQDLSSRALFDRSSQEYGTAKDFSMANFEAENQRALTSANAALQQQLTGAQLMSDEVASNRNLAAYLQQLQLEALLGQQGIDLSYANIGVQRDLAKDASRNNLLSSGINAVLPSALNFGFSKLFPGGGLPGATGAGPGGIPLASAAGGGGGFASMLPALGLAAGGVAAYSALNDTGKALFAPLVNPIATAKKVGSSVSKAVKKVFPF